MNLDEQLKLQAYLDGELEADDHAEVAAWLARDGGARALLGELQHTRDALAGNEPEQKLGETREFYWSKIQRQIERETKSAEAPRETASWLRWLRYATPLAGAAVLVGMLTVSSRHLPGVMAGETETSEQMTAFTFRSQSDPMTVVWLADKDTSGLEQDAGSNNLEGQ